MREVRMENFVKNIKQHIEEEIERIGRQPIDACERSRLVVGFVQSSLVRLKSVVQAYRFKSPEEEILFFKVWKPQISGLLIFYTRKYQIEKKCAGKSASARYKYLRAEYARLNDSFKDVRFYEYYRSGKTELDSLYFIRENYDILADEHCRLWDRDATFTTLHDSSVAEILATDRLKEELTREIDSLCERLHFKFTSLIENRSLQWTESKVALVEFIYALYAGQCFNHGQTPLKDIAFCCETLFHIEIGDFYRIFLEVRNRKRNRTQFIDKLKEKIVKMMDDLDG